MRMQKGVENMADIKNPSSTQVMLYCIENKLFTNGDSYQYGRMFKLVDDGFPLSNIATIIWFCSDTDKTPAIIEQELEALAEQRRKEAENAKSNVNFP